MVNLLIVVDNHLPPFRRECDGFKARAASRQSESDCANPTSKLGCVDKVDSQTG